MKEYYSLKLAAENLKRCYELAPPRIQQYLDAEVNHVLKKINRGNKVLELGCGYGRILPYLAKKAGNVIGIDTSKSSLEMGRQQLASFHNISLEEMNALDLKYENDCFDIVFCLQNGISAFQVDRLELIKESIRVTRSGGLILFSSYSDKIWDDRLRWFELQAGEGLIGEIDYSKTNNGNIVCKDGFSATTLSYGEFTALVSKISNIKTTITEIDSSSIFLEIIPCKN